MKLLSLIVISVETALLIVILQGIRVIFRKQLHPNIRYALWLFVALRILIPIKLEIPVALPQYMTYVPFVNSIMERQENAEYYRNLFADNKENEAPSDDQRMDNIAGSSGGQRDAKSDMPSEDTDDIRDDNASGIQDSQANTVIVNYDKSVDSESDSSPKKVIENHEKKSDRSIVYIAIRILYVVWLLGILVLSVYVLIGNIRMDRYLRKERKELHILPNGLKVYEVQGYNCLFGILHPSIYVSGRYSGWKEQEADYVQAHITDQKKETNQEQVSDAQIMEYVISHESEHYRVKDHIWQMVRILCLILQWFNPFVWWAYRSSKQDCELACDYRTTRGMNREERYTYGESLLAVLESNLNYRNRLIAATSMGEQKRFLSERIRGIMNRPSKIHILMTGGIVIAMIVLSLISVSIYVNNRDSSRTAGDNSDRVSEQQNTDLAFDVRNQNEESDIQSEQIREQIKTPTQNEVESARAQALGGMTEEEIADFKSYVKNENQLWENRYFSNFFSDIEDPNSMMWNVLEESGDVQCGWAEELDSNGNIVGRVPVIAYNEKGADMCVEELEQYYDMVQSDTLKQDIEDLIYNYRMAKDTHRWEYAAEIFHMYHDMDYYLLRYGREDVGKYTMDQSFVSRYYGVLHEYDRQQMISPALVMQTPQPTDLDAANVYAGKAPVYPELDEELLEQQLNRSHWIDDMICEDANLPLHGCEGYYIVTIPVICYNAQSNQYAVDGNYLVFDDITDLGNNAGLHVVLSEDGSYQNSGFISGLIPMYLTEIMIANPDQEYIFLYNGTAMCMIDEDNTLYTSPYSDELQVVGDYYHALDYKNIAVSYRNLTDSAHLLYYRDDDSDGSYVRQALPDAIR